MDKGKYTILFEKLTVEEYQSIRSTTSWDTVDNNTVKRALKNDIYTVKVYDNSRIIGMGRIIGDGALYFYIQDVIVLPSYQGKGIGKMIMNSIESYLSQHCFNNSFVGLMAAKGVQTFYYRFGYIERPTERPGMYKIMKNKTSQDSL